MAGTLQQVGDDCAWVWQWVDTHLLTHPASLSASLSVVAVSQRRLVPLPSSSVVRRWELNPFKSLLFR